MRESFFDPVEDLAVEDLPIEPQAWAATGDATPRKITRMLFRGLFCAGFKAALPETPGPVPMGR